jgi:putative flippase GtrA
MMRGQRINDLSMSRFALPAMFTSYEKFWSEIWNIFKFGVVGCTSLALNAGVYWVLTRIFWTDGPKTFLSVVAVCVSAIYNFTLHRAWTFRTQHFSGAMVARYLGVIALGAFLSGVLFYVGHEMLHIYDIVVLIGSAFLVAGATYTLHRWFTFHPKHG